jgi:mono/diheme cytochrome c family protein
MVRDVRPHRPRRPGDQLAALQFVELAQQFRDYPDGKIYWVIVNGKNAMPGHAADLTLDQRWAVVHHVRALQRAQNAKDEDLR